MITATPFPGAAAYAKLEESGPLEEAAGDPMHTWQIHETIRKLYVLF